MRLLTKIPGMGVQATGQRNHWSVGDDEPVSFRAQVPPSAVSGSSGVESYIKLLRRTLDSHPSDAWELVSLGIDNRQRFESLYSKFLITLKVLILVLWALHPL